MDNSILDFGHLSPLPNSFNEQINKSPNKNSYKEELNRIIPTETYKSWVKDGSYSVVERILYDSKQKKLTILVTGKSNFYRDWIIQNHLQTFKKVAKSVFGQETTVFVARKDQE
jgi:chromosomal replication initiation ATPase DnaA